MTNSNDIKGMMFQGRKEEEIEKILKDALWSYQEKFGKDEKPEYILVNSSVDLKTFEGVTIKKDKLMYSPTLVWMGIPKRLWEEK